VKQYASDVFFVLSMYYFTIKKYSIYSKKYIYTGLLGAIGVFLSNVSPIVLTCVGLYLILDHRSKNDGGEKAEKKYLLFILFFWAVLFLFYYLMFIRNHPSRAGMIRYWSKANAFMPTNPFSADFYEFLYEKSSKIISILLPFSEFGAILISLLFLFGCLFLIKNSVEGLKKIWLFNSYRTGLDHLSDKSTFTIGRGRFGEKIKAVCNIIFRVRSENKIHDIFLIYLLVLLPLLHLGLSGMKIYPIHPRLILYTFPVFIIIIGFGLQATTNFFKNKISRILKFFLIFIHLLGTFFYYKKMFPFKHEEIKDSIVYIENNKRPEEKIYICSGAEPA
jgi:hypothetical protein